MSRNTVCGASLAVARWSLATSGALGPSAGFCFYTYTTSGAGDVGFCAEMCDTTNDCAAKASGATCDTSYASAIGHGVCVF